MAEGRELLVSVNDVCRVCSHKKRTPQFFLRGCQVVMLAEPYHGGCGDRSDADNNPLNGIVENQHCLYFAPFIRILTGFFKRRVNRLYRGMCRGQRFSLNAVIIS